MRTGTAYCLLALLLALGGCEKNDNDNDNNENENVAGEITFTTVPGNGYGYVCGDPNTLYFGATARQLIVDWGDGSAPETYTNVTIPENENYLSSSFISHTYPAGSTTYTVQIKGEGLTGLLINSKYNSCYFRGVLTLDVSKCPALQNLYCGHSRVWTRQDSS